MSIRIMSLVWEVPLADSDKLILLALADWSDDDGNCWPSIAQLAGKTSKSERTVQTSIQSLVAAGHLTRTEVVGRGCKYRVHPRKDCTPAVVAPRKQRTPADTAPPQGTTQTPAAAAPNTSIHTNTSQEASPPSRIRAQPKSDPFPCPEGVDPAHWRDFRANRKAKHAKDTPTAHAGILRKLAAFSDEDWPPGRILQHAAESGWAGIYDPRTSVSSRHGPSPASATLRGSRPDPALDLMRMGQARLAAERGDPDPHRGAWVALPAGGRS